MTLIVNEEIPGNLTRSAKMVAGTLRTHGDLTGLKLGLAAVMFLYVTVACSLPLIFVHCVQYHSRRRISRQSSESGAWDPEMYSIRTGCISWTPERLAILTGRSNCLAAGALLSVGFLDVFVDAMENMEETLEKLHVNTSFPISSFTTLLGFLLIVGVEQITLDYYHQPRGQVKATEKSEIVYHGITIRRANSARSSIRERAMGLTGMSEAVVVAPEETMESVDETTNQAQLDNRNHHEGHSHLHSATELAASNWARIMILLFAISLHSVFEGMTLGLCESLTSLLTLFTALSLHKLLIAVSIGINVASETNGTRRSGHERRKLVIYQSLAVFTFAGASPLGALIGWAVTDRAESVWGF
ncbi:Zinc transporter ZIP3 [Fasciolopsis buskii]|uniref:Zinc transporter ZIP3 n=1 Tax=Fasciolopsis buskii TaxID=27845 RepID=A0A8E0RM16_9TREM|nr:Zinc transporter ZIP3 [Fasciolopsis buski]